MRKERDMKVLYDGNFGIVLRTGYVVPFASRPATECGGISHEAMINDELRADTELLREVVSARVIGEELIPPEVFYFDQWDLRPFTHRTVGSFLRSVHPTVRIAGGGRAQFVERDGTIVALASTVGPRPKFSSEVFRKKGVRPEQQESYRETNHRDYAEDIRETLLGRRPFSNLIRIDCYEPADEEERQFLLHGLERRHMPAYMHCVLVGRRYERSGDPMYEHFSKRTPGKVRDIWAPRPDVKEALRHLLKPLAAAYDPHRRSRTSKQFAYVRGKSIVDNARPHAGNNWMVKCDIEGFFDHCTWPAVRRYVSFVTPTGGPSCMSSEDSSALKPMLINPETGGLYQGSPVSGAISNAILAPAVRYLENILNRRYVYGGADDRTEREGAPAGERRVALTVYADDITVSANFELKPRDMRSIASTVDWVFADRGMPFRLKPSKTRLVRRNGRLVTGVRINHLDQMTVPRKRYRFLKTALEHAAHGKPVTNPATGRSMPDHELKGHLAFALMVDDSGKVRRLVGRYFEELKSRKLVPSSAWVLQVPQGGEGSENDGGDGPDREGAQDSVHVDTHA